MNEKILRILCEVCPEINFADSRNFTADGLLDSFDMIVLITELELAFGVKIDGVEVVPENFSSISTISALVQRSIPTS